MPTLQEISSPQISGDVPFPPAVADQLKHRAKNLQMLPAVAMQALDLAKNPDCGINEFAAVVERDAALAAEILKLSNSIMFAGGRSVMNLHQAVVRLGFRQCKSLIIASSFSSRVKKLSLDEEWVREALYRHSFTTALLALNLNRSLNVGFQGEEFTGGLIHDIGRMLLATCYPDQFAQIDPLNFEEGPETLAHEQSVIDTNHCDVGVWFARNSQLPEPLIDVLRYHHSPEQAVNNRRFVALITTCDDMANHLHRVEEAAGYESQNNPGIRCLEEAGVRNAVSRLSEIGLTLMDAAQRDVTEMLAM